MSKKEKAREYAENILSPFYPMTDACFNSYDLEEAFEAGWDACEAELDSLFQLLPEQIVDEKSHQVYKMSIYHYDGQCVVDYVGEIDQDSLYSFSGNTLHEAIEKACNWFRSNSNDKEE